MPWVVAALAFAVTCVVFRPALDGEWLDWDDKLLLVDETEWRGLSDAHLSWMLGTFHMGPYQPLSWLSYAVDHSIWGMDARGYHLTNVCLHAGSAACLYFLARRLFDLALQRRATRDAAGASPAPRHWIEAAAAFSALAWSLHPMRVESVAWITERRDCLSGVLLLLASIAWLAHARKAEPGARGGLYWLALLAFVASLAAKGLGLVLPLALLALDAWPLRRFAPRAGESARARALSLVLEKWPFFAASAAAAALAVAGQRAAGAVFQAEYHGPAERIAQALYGLAFYVRKAIWPSDLMVLYPMSVPLDVGEARFVASGAAVAVACVVLALARRRAPAAVVAAVAYALFVGPVLGLMQTGSQLVADRYAYLGSLPLSLLAGGALLLAALRVRASRAGPIAGAFVVAAGVALLPLLARATRAQIPVWHDTFSLWRHDLEIDPDSSPARRNWVAAWIEAAKAETEPSRRRETFERALAECQAGLERRTDAVGLLNAAKIHDLLAAEDPDQRQRHLELGLEHGLRGVEWVERTVQRLPEIYESCGVILCELGRPSEAVPHFERAVRVEKPTADRLGLLGEALMQAGRTREAIPHLEEACRLAPDRVPLLLDLADAHRLLGEAAAAIDVYRRVIGLTQRRAGRDAAADPDYQYAARAMLELEAR